MPDEFSHSDFIDLQKRHFSISDTEHNKRCLPIFLSTQSVQLLESVCQTPDNVCIPALH